jgi:hypothetical protein
VHILFTHPWCSCSCLSVAPQIFFVAKARAILQTTAAAAVRLLPQQHCISSSSALFKNQCTSRWQPRVHKAFLPRWAASARRHRVHKSFVPWVGGRRLPEFYLKKISGSFSELLSQETSCHPFTHAMNDTNSRARDLDLASASSGVFNSSHLDFGHPFGRTDGRHACAIAAPLVTVGFAVPTFRVSDGFVNPGRWILCSVLFASDGSLFPDRWICGNRLSILRSRGILTVGFATYRVRI